MNLDYHSPVLLEKVTELLRVDVCRVVVNVTLGDAGFEQAFFPRMPAESLVYGIDLDQAALDRAQNRLRKWSERLYCLLGNFRDIEELLPPEVVGNVDAVLADLGVSFLQFNDPAKGFMFSQSGPLNMRLDGSPQNNAYHVVNQASEAELARIIYQYGEERQSRRIARAIVAERQISPIETTGDLARVVRAVAHPVKVIKTLARVFMGLRIYVNDEVANLEQFLPKALKILKPGGRLAVLSYHSTEDRLVKKFIRDESATCICPTQFPVCVCDKKATLKPIGKLIVPDDDEIRENSNARSARLRIAEKL